MPSTHCSVADIKQLLDIEKALREKTYRKYNIVSICLPKCHMIVFKNPKPKPVLLAQETGDLASLTAIIF